MTPKAITFDCAQTLIRVRYDPAALAVDCAQDVGLALDADEARSLYGRLLQSSWAHYRQLNLSRDPDVCSGFWAELTEEWLRRLELPQSWVQPLMEAGDRRLYGPQSEVFSLFPDVIPCLERLKQTGTRIAILSNWDYTLHRVVESQGIGSYFEHVVASLEEGVEKPEAALFEIAASRLGLSTAELVHVGDDPIDDFQGALGAGCGAILLDRGQSEQSGRVISSLDSLEGALACC
jgi:putative hydrolase of the HAD superfamily